VLLQIVTYTVVEENKENKGIWFCRTMMRALELHRLAKSTPWDKVTLNSEEIKPIGLVDIQLCLSEGISQIVSRQIVVLVGLSVSQSVV